MTRDYVSYKTMGAMNRAQVYMTPEIHIWRNNKKTQKSTKEQFDNQIKKIIQDIITLKRPSRGKVKIVAKCQQALFYMRLNDDGERILFDYKYDLGSDKKSVINVKLYVLAVSNKKIFKKYLKYLLNTKSMHRHWIIYILYGQKRRVKRLNCQKYHQ